MNQDDVVSCHHEWMQRLPLRDNVLLCIDCLVEALVKQLPKHRQTCHPKLEEKRSGYRGPTLEKWLSDGNPMPHNVFVLKEGNRD